MIEPMIDQMVQRLVNDTDTDLTYHDLDQRLINLMDALGIVQEKQEDALGYWYKITSHDDSSPMKDFTDNEMQAFRYVLDETQKGQTLQ